MPILLISNNVREINRFITDFVKKYAILPFSIFKYKKSPNVISIEHVREVQSHLVRVNVAKRLFILHDFETARKETQNAFLKTLEEKGDTAYFILISSSIGSILPTVISRCTVHKLKMKNEKLKMTLLKENDFLVQSLPQLFNDYIVTDRDKAIWYCDGFLTTIRKMMKDSQTNNPLPLSTLPKILKEILKTRNLILKNNVNAQIAIDHILYEVKKNYLLTNS
ncbi:MAG TPA: hypothetical protein VJB63_01035 [Patescibacteria group bacterium]|nr:hypothetical protein [Patescibacteria group bacterium]